MQGVALARGLGNGAHTPCAIAVRVREMEGNVCVESKLLEQADIHRARPRVTTNQAHLRRDAAANRLEVKCFHGTVHSLFRHLTVGRPLTTRDRQQAAVTHVDHVVTHETLRVVGRRVLDQRAEATPGTQHVRALDRHIGVEVVPHFVQDPFNLFLTGQRVRFDLAGHIRRAGNRGTLPGQEKDHTTVTRRRVEQTHATGTEVTRERNVHTRRWRHNLRRRWFIHPANGITEGTRGIHHTLRTNVKLISRHLITQTRTNDAALVRLVERDDFAVIRSDSAMLDSRQHERNVHTRIILLAIVVHDTTSQVVRAEHREGLQRLVATDDIRIAHVLLACDKVVQERASIVVGNKPPRVCRNQNGQRRRQIGRNVQKGLTLPQSFFHHLVLFPVKLLDGLLKVAHTTVNEFRGLGRCFATKVLTIHHRHLEATCGTIERHTGARRTSTDDKQIKAISIVLLRRMVRMFDLGDRAVAHGLVRWHEQRLGLVETAIRTQRMRR